MVNDSITRTADAITLTLIAPMLLKYFLLAQR